MAASKRLGDSVYLIIKSKKGDVVFRKRYAMSDFYDGEHGWDSSQWLKKRSSFESEQTYTDSAGEVEKVVYVRYDAAGKVVGMKELDGSGAVSFQDGVYSK